MNDVTRRAAVLALAAAALAAPGPARAAPKESPWGRSYFPDVPLVTHDGKAVRFYSDLVEDKIVVVSFIYTRCTKQCGPMTANLARVQRELGDRVGKDVFFYSLTLDPARDTPEVLAEYARSFKAGPGWIFLTGKDEDITLIRKKLGDLTPVEDHSTSLSVGNDATGEWITTRALERPQYLAVVIGGWLDPGWRDRGTSRSYAEVASRVTTPDRARTLFSTRCASCHAPDGDSVGPPLDGVVARRGREWTARWIKEPDRVLQERDPIATRLVEQHGGVAMPNLGLTDDEVADLVDLLERGGAAPAAARGEAQSLRAVRSSQPPPSDR